MASSSSSLTVGSAQIGAGSEGSRWQSGAPPIRYPDPNIKTLDPRFSSLVLGITKSAAFQTKVKKAQERGSGN